MNVLLINLARIGDLVQVSPVSQGLMDELGARVTLLAPEKYAEFARRLSGVDEVIGVDDSDLNREGIVLSSLIHSDPKLSQAIADLRAHSFDLAINLTHDELSTALASAIGAKAVRGRFGQPGHIQVRGDAFRYFYTVLEHRMMNGINLCDIYRIGAGIANGRRPVSMAPVPEDRRAIRDRIGETSRPVILLHPGANHPHRRWPVSKYGALAKMLHAEGAEVLVLAGPAERDLAGAVVRLSNGSARAMDKPVPVELLPALFAEVNLVVTNDTGPLHIAASVGTPTISLFLAMARPQDTGPCSPEHLILETLESCHPCPEHSACDSPVCGDSIPVEVVFAAVRARLRDSLPAESVFKPFGGRFRALVTRWGANGMIELEEIYRSVPIPDGFDVGSAWKPVWLSLFAGDSPSGEVLKQLRGTFSISEQRSMLAVVTLCRGILARLNGEPLQDEQGNPLSVAVLEDFALQEEQRSQSAKTLLLPFRLEREALYARGIDAVRNEAESRFSRWIGTLAALSPDAVREEVAA